MSLRALTTLAALALAGLALSGVLDSGATFTHEATNPQSASAVPDFTPPVVASSVIAKAAGGTAGYIKQGGSYRVYANVTDSGNPSSGVSTVTADVSNVTSGQSAVALSAGSYTVDGTTYNYRSAALTANGSLSAGSKSYTVSSTDGASNSATKTGLSVTVDNTAPTGSDIQTADGGGTSGKPEAGDTVTFTYSKAMDPASIIAGWSGSSGQSVVVRIINNGKTDSLEVYDSGNSSILPLGSVALDGDFVSADTTFGASGTASTLQWTSSTTFRVTLGAVSGSTVRTNKNNSDMIWTPASGATDRAGNATSTSNVNESGASDKDF